MCENREMTDTKSNIIMSKELIGLLKECEKYTKHDYYVFKVCCDLSRGKYSTRWFIVMQKLKESITNEKRKDIVDGKHAMYRADRLHVVDIFDMYNPERKVNSTVHTYFDEKIQYKIGKTVRPNFFDNDLNIVNTGGIHYFKTPIAAFYYIRILPFDNYVGDWIDFYSNGQRRFKCSYKKVIFDKEKSEIENNKSAIDGRCTEWNDNGTIRFEYLCYNGKITSTSLDWIYEDEKVGGGK